MNETEQQFRIDLQLLLDKYNAEIRTDLVGQIWVECNPDGNFKPYAEFKL